LRAPNRPPIAHIGFESSTGWWSPPGRAAPYSLYPCALAPLTPLISINFLIHLQLFLPYIYILYRCRASRSFDNIFVIYCIKEIINPYISQRYCIKKFPNLVVIKCKQPQINILAPGKVP
jgi:hypothetical protein